MDQEQRDRVADEIKQAMADQAVSATALARRAEVSQNTITRVTTGQPTQDGTIRKVRAALGILPVTQTETVDPDVEAVVLSIRTWLNGTPKHERPHAVADLIECVIEGRVRRALHPNG